MTSAGAQDAILEHVAAFNAHDSVRLRAGFATEVVWTTGADTFRGSDEVAEVFDPWLWALTPALEVLNLVVDGASASAELRETLVVDGATRTFHIAGFFTVVDGLITRAKIYREGSADLGGSD